MASYRPNYEYCPKVGRRDRTGRRGNGRRTRRTERFTEVRAGSRLGGNRKSGKVSVREANARGTSGTPPYTGLHRPFAVPFRNLFFGARLRQHCKRRHPFEHEGLPSCARCSRSPACLLVSTRLGSVTRSRPSSERSAGRDFASPFRARYASCLRHSATCYLRGSSEGKSVHDAVSSEVEVRWNTCGQ